MFENCSLFPNKSIFAKYSTLKVACFCCGWMECSVRLCRPYQLCKVSILAEFERFWPLSLQMQPHAPLWSPPPGLRAPVHWSLPLPILVDHSGFPSCALYVLVSFYVHSSSFAVYGLPLVSSTIFFEHCSFSVKLWKFSLWNFGMWR